MLLFVNKKYMEAHSSRLHVKKKYQSDTNELGYLINVKVYVCYKVLHLVETQMADSSSPMDRFFSNGSVRTLIKSLLAGDMSVG